jgi:imidazolonepropionase-like amidohydrolase
MYLGPGLVDAHVHYSQTGWVDGRPDAIDLRSRYPYDSVMRDLAAHPGRFDRAYLCTGVTTVFDVGGYPWTLDLARRSRSSTASPRILATGPLLATVQVDSQMAGQFAFMKDESAVRSAVRAHHAAGADALKVWYIEVPDSLRPHMRAMLMAAADEARTAGLRLVVHATELDRAKEALEAKAVVLVHGVFEGVVDSAFLAAAKEHGTIVVPTLSALEGYADVFLGRTPAQRYPLECLDPLTRAKLETMLPDTLRTAGKAFWSSPGAEQLRATAGDNLRRMFEAGIPIAVGTDAGNPGTAAGPSIYREMELLHSVGMPHRAVFASATIIAARALALDTEVGSIEAGKRADLVVFAADPTADIRNARRVRYVVRNGTLYPKAALLPR